MTQDLSAGSEPSIPPQSFRSPIEGYLVDLHARLAGLTDGKVADYIPELGRADPNHFAIAIATVDGYVYRTGAAAHPFTIQSVSKPFMYGYALRAWGKDHVVAHVGVEPTGEAFNSIILDDVHNRPFNPMVNAGAIAVAELMLGADRDEREANMVDLFSQFAGRRLTIDQEVFRSEHATGHRNRAIAYMMLNSGMIRRDPEDLLDLYFKQCSIKVTCTDLAVMAATLANHGINPLTGHGCLESDHVRDVLTLMNSCGMYNYAGQWAYEVGIPAKSGVSGAVIAVIPGQIGIAVYSPPLDAHGNSIRGVEVCREVSDEFGLHVFYNRTNVRSVIRREYTGDKVHSKRLRTPAQRAVLQSRGSGIAVIELQGGLFFGAVERLIRRIGMLAENAEYIVVDFNRVNVADAGALRLIEHLVHALAEMRCGLALTHLMVDGPLSELRTSLSQWAKGAGMHVFGDTDAALEFFEDRILDGDPRLEDLTKFSLAELDVFAGLTTAEIKLLEQIVQPLHFDAGETIINEGDAARLFFVVARGSVSVHLPMQGGRSRRIACIGPGLSFGEMALLDGGQRSANVVADEAVICYGFSVLRIREVAAEHPNLLITILGNLTRDFSERLRAANEEIRSLE